MLKILSWPGRFALYVVVKERRDYRFIGNPRSGAKWLSTVLCKAGLDVGHERVGQHGTVSWILAVDDPVPPSGDADAAISYRYRTTVLFLRNPFHALPSLVLENRSKRSFPFRREHIRRRLHIDVKEIATSEADLAALTLLRWHQLCLSKRPTATIKVDDPDSVASFLASCGIGDGTIRRALKVPPKNTADRKWPKRKKPVLDERFMENIQLAHRHELGRLALAHGYELPSCIEVSTGA